MQILTLDMLSLNTDRHFNNLGLIVDASTGVYKAAPIFDNGNSLLSDQNRFDEETVEENLEKVYGQPFSASLEMQAREAGIGLMVDYEKLQYILEKEPVSRGLEVLMYQLKRQQPFTRAYRKKDYQTLQTTPPWKTRRRFTMRLLLVNVARGNMRPTSPAGKQRGDWVDRFPQGYLLLLDCGKFSL